MSWYGLLKRSAETPKRFMIAHKALWLKASAFHCGRTMTAFLLGRPCPSKAGNQRAFTTSFSGYCVRTGEMSLPRVHPLFPEVEHRSSNLTKNDALGP